MSVKIRKMTNDEFENFCQWSVEDHAKELMEECQMPREEAMMKAKEEVTQMLPNGLNTEYNYLMTIVEEDSEESAGFIWTIHEETEGKKQSFVCDFAIWESKRRRGYATETLHLVEKNAVEAGCQESVLFVADSNVAARNLYEKCGYHIRRQAGYGKYMIKQLS